MLATRALFTGAIPIRHTLVLGDSTSEGEEWPDAAQALLTDGHVWIVEAAGSRTSGFYVSNQGWAAQDHERLLLLLGFNDKSTEVAPATFGANMATIIGLSGAAEVYVLNGWDIPPGSNAWSLYQAQMDLLAATVIDTASAIDGVPGMLSGDDVHPTTLGYQTIGEVVAAALA